MFIDRAPLNNHPLYKLGESEVVFKDWENLWERITACRRDPSSMPWFGNESENMVEFDPFRDGKAAERIGSYIGSVASDLANGLASNDAKVHAREQYVALWGADKEVRLRCLD